MFNVPGGQTIARGRKSKSKGKSVYDERAADVKPLVDTLLAGYARHGLFPRAAALELNWRVAATAQARHLFFVQLLVSWGLPRITSQYLVLRDIYFAEEMRLSQSQIMRLYGVSSANVTRLIHGLEGSGLARRTTNPEDKRSTFVTLTDAGLDLCERLIPAIGKQMTILGDCFSDAELAMFNEFLERLHIHIEGMTGDLDPEGSDFPVA